MTCSRPTPLFDEFTNYLNTVVTGAYKTIVKGNKSVTQEAHPPCAYILRNPPQNTPSLSHFVTGVNREVIKQSFQLCGISATGLALPVAHLNARLGGILGYREGLEVARASNL